MLYRLSANLENSSMLVYAQHLSMLFSCFHDIGITVLQMKIEAVEFKRIMEN